MKNRCFIAWYIYDDCIYSYCVTLIIQTIQPNVNEKGAFLKHLLEKTLFTKYVFEVAYIEVSLHFTRSLALIYILVWHYIDGF